MTAGLSSASFWRIASALRYSASASAGLPVSDSSNAEVVVAVRQAAAEFGDGGVVVGQLLVDRQRPAVLGLRLRRLARVRQQDADPEDRVRQVVAGVVGGLGSGGQRLLVGPRQPVGRQGVGGLARGLSGANPFATGSPPARPAPTDRHPPGRPAATPTAGRTPAPRPSCRSLRAALRPRSGCGRRRPWPRRRPPARPPAPREPPAPHDAPPGRPRCGRPCPSGRPARSWTAPGPAARRCRSPCRAGRRACRRSPRPISRAGRAAP